MLTENQLRSYLAWMIHGRKTQLRATSPMRKGPPRDKAYLAWIREMPCSACGLEGRSEAAHTGTDGGMSQKPSDYSCLRLCADCHTQAPGAYHRAGKRAFERTHGFRCAVLVRGVARFFTGRPKIRWTFVPTHGNIFM